MLFNSLEFLLAFLPPVLGIFLLLEAQTKSSRPATNWLLLASLAFYSYWRWQNLPILLGSIAFNYSIVQGIFLKRGSRRMKSVFLYLGVCLNLGLLAYFKYRGFLFGSQATSILPLGISFFTFLQIAYLVDSYRGPVRSYRAGAYALFVTVFPHLIAGPLVHHDELVPQFERKRPRDKVPADLAVGLSIFILGLAKKVLIADPLAEFSDPVFASVAVGARPDFFEAWMGALGFTFQLYFDFSGYSDMAIGVARAFGIRLPANFNSPYRSTSIIDFWRRWHITLSRFLRDYLYIPLGGNQRGPIRRYVNLLITMLLGGLWHGANWTFVAWGFLHGIYLTANHLWRAATARRLPPLVGGALTFLAVAGAWVFFKSSRFEDAFQILRGMAGSNGFQFDGTTPSFLARTAQALVTRDRDYLGGLGGANTLTHLTKTVAFVTAAAVAFFLPNTQQWMRRFEPTLDPAQGSSGMAWRPTVPHALVLGGLFFVLMKLIATAPSTVFLYFEF